LDGAGVTADFGNRHEAIVLDNESNIPESDIMAIMRETSVGREKLAVFGIQPSIVLVLVSAPPALMAIFTAPSIGSLKGTSIRSRPCS
jgi:hypothetical protein